MDAVGGVFCLTVVLATVFFAQYWDLVVCVVLIGAVVIQQLLIVCAVQLKVDRRCAFNATYEEEVISLRNICQVGDDGQSWVGQRLWKRKSHELSQQCFSLPIM